MNWGLGVGVFSGLAAIWCYGLLGVRERWARMRRSGNPVHGPYRWPAWALLPGWAWWCSLLFVSAFVWAAAPRPWIGVGLLLQAPVGFILHSATWRVLRRWPLGDDRPVRAAFRQLATTVETVEGDRKTPVGARQYVHGVLRLTVGTLPILVVVALAQNPLGARDSLVVLAAWLLPVGLSFFCLLFLVVLLAGGWIRGYSLRSAMSRVVRAVGIGSGLCMVLAVVGGGMVAAMNATPTVQAGELGAIHASLVPMMVHSLTVGALVGGLAGLVMELPTVATVLGDLAINALSVTAWGAALSLRLVLLPFGTGALATYVMWDDDGLAPRALSGTTAYEVLGWGLWAPSLRQVDPELVVEAFAPQIGSALPSADAVVVIAVVTTTICSVVGAARVYRLPGSEVARAKAERSSATM